MTEVKVESEIDDAQSIRAVGVPLLKQEKDVAIFPGLPDCPITSDSLAKIAVDLASGLRKPSLTPGSAMVLTPFGTPDVILLGVGEALGEGLMGNLDDWRKAGAALVRSVKPKDSTVVLLPEDAGQDVVSAVCEGALLASYSFGAYQSTKDTSNVDVPTNKTSASSLSILSSAANLKSWRRAAHLGERSAKAVMWARDLINTPPSDLTPSVFAALIERDLQKATSTKKVEVEVWDEHRIAKERLGGVLGVSKGSDEPPRFVIATYSPSNVGVTPIPHVVLVGKGITFDSGGLSIKTADGMVTMKTDMSGAAIVMGVVGACEDMGVLVKVTALAPMSENMTGGSAMKPGDVLTIRDGQTIEILNTDAEGRLVLADALCVAAEMTPAPYAIIDVATLTGAARIALGSLIAPIFSNDSSLQNGLLDAFRRCGESLWPMPLPKEYEKDIHSHVADMKNTGALGGQAGSIAAALLLQRFVGTVPWAHIDIAGTGRASEDADYLTRGGTAFGVRSLLAYLIELGTRTGRN